jgi:hypothetical protein
MSGATSALRSPIGPIAADPELRAFFRTLMEEVVALGRAKGVALDPAFVEGSTDFMMNKVELGMKASMAVDLDRGNRLELDWLSGKVRELGRQYKIPTPASDTVYTVLKLHRMGSPHQRRRYRYTRCAGEVVTAKRTISAPAYTRGHLRCTNCERAIIATTYHVTDAIGLATP